MTGPGLTIVKERTEQAPAKGLVRQNSFPTILFQGQIDNSTKLNRSILAAISAEFDKADSENTTSGIEVASWRSARNLHRNAQFRPLKQEIDAALAMISSELRYSKDHRLKITSMWASINPPGTSSPAACRPGNLWSGCYGVQVPKGTGSIKFIDPRTINVMNPPKYEKDEKPRDCFTKITAKPREGRIVMFPAWLYHEVEPNLAKDEGAAGNYVFVSFTATQAKR